MLAFAISLNACKKDDKTPDDVQDPTNEPEQITKVVLNFTNDSTNVLSSFSWSDNDGTGGNDPIIDTVLLSKNSSYTLAIDFIDGSGTAEESLTSEIKAEADEHMICFDFAASFDGTVVATKTDSDGTFPIGLESAWTTDREASGNLVVTLKHQPDGAKNGTCTPGETDAEVSFYLIVN